MSNQSNMKTFLFNSYNEDLSVVKQLFGIPDSKLFACPLCYREFSISQLDDLSPEHIPPQFLGGKDKDCTLTCKACNHTTAISEGRLGEFINAVDVFSGVPDISVKIKYDVITNDDLDEEGKSKKESSPIYPATFNFDGRTKTITGIPGKYIDTEALDLSTVKGFRIHYHGTPSSQGNFNHALLKIGYLTLFRELGYFGVGHPAMTKVRQQIFEPETKILPRTWVAGAYNLPDDLLGVNLIIEPVEYQSFAVVFDICKNKGFTHRFIVFLPLPLGPGIAIYDNLPSVLDNKAVVKLDNVLFNGRYIPLQGKRTLTTLEKIELLNKYFDFIDVYPTP